MSKREELEQAIANLETQRAVLGDATVDAAIAGIRMQMAGLKPEPKRQDQRKQVTVLFADVSGFTAMSETMDAEDLQATMNALWQQVDQAIIDHNGRIDKHIGDAVMAIWGVDAAREDDPEQAIRAALAMQAAVRAFAEENDAPLQMRIGLNTGLVLLGEVGTTAEYTAMGDTVNIASRLEHAAPVGGILISHDTYRQVRGVFDVEPQNPLTVKGKSEPLHVYVVRRAKPRAFRMGTRGVEGVETRMVGRDVEMKRLQDAWQTAVFTPRTTLLTIGGDAGVGKSRLLYEFEQWLDWQPATILLFKGRSAEQTRGTPYFLLRDLLATRFGIRESDQITDVRQKFEAAIADVLTDEAEMKAHFLGQWLGYDFSHSPHVSTIGEDAEQLKNRGLLYLSQYWAAMAGDQPVTIFLEDIHWADDPSLDAILDMLRREPTLPLLVVALARPSLVERRPEWQSLGQENRAKIEGFSIKEPAYRIVNLAPLPTAADRELLAEILQKVEEIPEILFNLLIGRAEGNPFYMEELVKMLIDDGVIVPHVETWQIDLAGLNEGRIPGTLTGVLQARLDRLAMAERATLQRASVVGRVFWDSALHNMGDDPNQVPFTLLQERELIFKQQESAFADTEQFLFKHDLLREVTYQTVLKRARQTYHEQVAEWLGQAAEANGRLEEYAAVIGTHYQMAQKLTKAARWFGRAGQSAADRFAHEEAIHYLSLASDLTPNNDYPSQYRFLLARERSRSIQGNRDAQRGDLELLAHIANQLSVSQQAEVALRQALYADYIADYDQANIHAQTAIELGRRGHSPNLMSKGYERYAMVLLRQGDHAESLEQAQIALKLAERAGNQDQIANCWHGLGLVISSTQWDYDKASDCYEKALDIYQAIGDRGGEGSCLHSLGWAASGKKDYATAKIYFERALTIMREIGSRQGMALILGALGQIAMRQGDLGLAKAYFEQVLTESTELKNPALEAYTFGYFGDLSWKHGDYETASRYAERSLAIRLEIGLQDLGISYINLGSMAKNLGDFDTAEKYYEEGLALCREVGDRMGEGIGLNELGQIALVQSNFQLAEICYQQALIIRQELDQPHFVVEDLAGMAQLYLAQGNRNGAKETVRKIVDYLHKNRGRYHGYEPMRTFHFTWRVLTDLDQPAEANYVLTLAANVIQDYLDKNSNPELQAMYLAQPHHKVMWAAWQEKQKDTNHSIDT